MKSSLSRVLLVKRGDPRGCGGEQKLNKMVKNKNKRGENSKKKRGGNGRKNGNVNFQGGRPGNMPFTYGVERASNYGLITQSSAPRMSSNKNCLKICHQEFMESVRQKVTGVKEIERFIEVNPGTAFPWLKSIASRFETYKFNKLVFHYHSSCQTTVKGTFAMQFDCDPADLEPDRAVDLLGQAMVVEGNVWASFSLNIPIFNLEVFRRRFVRVGVSPGDIKTYDVGALNVFHDATVGNDILGRIFCEYEIELYTPQIQRQVSGSTLSPTPLATIDAYYPDPTAVDFQTDGKLPIKASIPTAQQVSDGATAARGLYNILNRTEGLLELRNDSPAPTNISTTYNAHEVTKQLINPDAITAGENVSTMAFKATGHDSWIQPIINDAVNPPTNLTTKWTLGDYASLIKFL